MNKMFTGCFDKIKDPRIDRTKKHRLIDIIAIAICAVIAGSEGWDEIEDFGNDQKDWLLEFLELPNGIPSHDTFSRVFSLLDSKNFQASCMEWMEAIRTLLPETVIAIDGKTLRGSARKRSGVKGLHIVNAWSCSNGITLGQLKVDGKSNEITAVPELIKQINIKGSVVTLDAMGCQEEIVNSICDAGSDYVIALKGNQGSLSDGVKDSFTLSDNKLKNLPQKSTSSPICGSHGRIDKRSVDVIEANNIKELIDPRWTNLNSLVRVKYSREEAGKVTKEERFYISSLPSIEAGRILGIVKKHWQVENCLHWSLDVAFSEDRCRIRDENAATNLSWLRKFTLGLLKHEASFKAGIRRKRNKASRSLAYLTKVITGI